ncbi:hypothetical protein HRbin16_01427 [bacterium HR16]|nr:hypothetical protein HRbin16_01427 [bacterium HR16]
MRNLLRQIALLLMLFGALLAWAEGENSPCAKLLPTTELKGWKAVNGSYLYGKGEGLTSIYNGGYQLYLKNGVQEAAQKLYQRGNLYATVTTHTMKDASAASKFVQYWRNTHRKQKPQSLKITGTGFWIQADGATTFYWAKGRFFVTVMVTRDDRQAVDAGLEVLRTIAGKVK